MEWTGVDSEGQVAHTIGIKPADETVADACLILTVAADFGIHDVKRAADVLDVEGMKSVPNRCGNGCIREAAGSRGQCVGAIVDVNVSIREVGGVKAVAAGVAAIGEARVDATRMAGGDDASGRIRTGARVPAHDVSCD